MIPITVREAWKRAYPGAAAGFLAMRGVDNPSQHPSLEQKKAELEEELRNVFSGSSREELRALPTIQAYNDYYSRFKKTYHVQLQLESVALKGKSLPRVAALVEAMFMAELKNLMLTAGHDLAALEEAVRVDVAKGDEAYTLLNGQEQTLKAGDMFMADARGVISSVLYGPDQRTRITPETTQAIFAVYAPPGIDAAAVHRHLEDIQANIRSFSPQAEAALLQVFGSE